MREFPRSLLWRYSVALALAGLAALSTALFPRFVGAGAFLLYLSTVVLSAWWGGFGPGLLATTICTFAFTYFLAVPHYSLFISDPNEALRLVLFIAVSGLFSWLIEVLHVAQRTAVANASALRMSEERYRRILDTAHEGIWMVNATGETEYVNHRMAEILGYSIEEMLGRPLRDFMDADSRKEAERSWERRRQGIKEQHDIRFRRKDGSDLWALVSTSPTYDAHGQFQGALALITDITQRKRAEESLRFIVDASQVLASSLDYESTLRSVARLAVPALADWCAVNTLEDDGTVRLLAVVHSDPAKEQQASALLRRYPPDDADAGGLMQVIRSGRPELYPELPDELLAKGARDPEHLELLRGLKMQSALIVPMRARGRTLGAITLVSAESGRHYEQADLTLAEALARRATLAVDNALLYREAQKEIAEREQVELDLRDSEERLRLALVAGRMGVWDWNVRTNAVQWSESLEPMHGLAPGTFGGTFEAFLALIHPDDRDRAAQAVRRALQDKSEYTVEFRNVWPDGSIHWIAGRGRAFCDAAGQVARMIGVGLDVTEHKRAEEYLRNQQRWLESVLDLMPTPTLFVEPGTGRVTFANKAANLMAGGEFPKGKPAEEYHTVYHCTDTQGRRIPDDQMPGARVARGERLDRFEMDWQLPAGTRSLLLYGATIPPGYGQPALGVIEFQDITQLKQIEAELRRSNKAKDEFLAMLGHELRNPLAPLLNALHIIRKYGAVNEPAEQARELAERQVRHLTRLVDDLLDVARITRGKIQLRKETLDLATVVARAIETSRPLIEARRHELTISLPDTPVRLLADATRVEQVLANLLNNAAKYTEEGGHIWLTAGREGGEAVMRVRDTGIGLPAEMLLRIFDPFVQAERSLARSEGGLGIGLTLVHSLVELHDGRVQVASEGPGLGSEFVVYLPAAPDIVDEPAGRGPKGSPGNGHPLRVLAVDDNLDAAKTLGLLLQASGHEVRLAHDGPHALEAVTEFQPQVVLLDIGLPRMDGFEVARRLRLLPGGDQIFLVALTGYGQEEDRQRSHEAGFNQHLVKPVEPEELEKLLAGQTQFS
jgi:PAS domain S-box-containing protein